MRIQHNIAALNSHRQLTANNSSVSKNLEKLSSGYRINRAGDDAAGLAISEKMRAQITGLETAQKNANDGISLVQTAEGALTEVHSMLNRMVELSEQSANGTYQDKVDRENLQKELVSLRDEIDRISEGTNFNGINLLDGSLSGGANGAGGLTGAAIARFKPAKVENIAASANAASADFDSSAFENGTGVDTLNIDGHTVKVDWSVLDADEQAAIKKDWADATPTAPDVDDTKAAAAALQKGINAAIDKANAANGSNIQHITVESNTAKQFTFTSGLKDTGSSKLELTASGSNSVLAKMGIVTASIKGNASSSLMVSADDLNGDFLMTLNGEEVAITTTGITDTTNLVDKLNTAITNALKKYDDAKGNTTADTKAEGKISVSLNNSGQLEFTNTSGLKLGFADKDGGEVAKSLGISAEGKASSGGLTLQIGDTADDFNKLTVSVDSMSSASLGLSGINIGTQEGAAAAIDKIKTAINTVSSTRGDLGALQNRLEHTINNLSVTSENMTAAESRIRDVDMAQEMMEFTKNNILTQASQSMLAQANQLPQGVLQLLQ